MTLPLGHPFPRPTLFLRAIFSCQAYRIRLLDPERQGQSESLRDNAKDFVEKVEKLGHLVAGYVGELEKRGTTIDKQKLLAVGLRNQVTAMEEERRRTEADLMEQIADRKRELDKRNRELEMLVKVKINQETLLARLSSANADI